MSSWSCLSLATLTALVLAGPAALAADEPPAQIANKVKVCAGCHGEQGVPIQKVMPVIWGQNAGYLFYQLRDFKSGARKNDIMSPIAANLDQPDLLPLAEFFSKLKWPNLNQPPAPDDVAKKAQAAAASIGCPGCHLAYFQGDGTTARLAGQNHDYLLKTMTDFRDGTRGNNPGMSDLMKATSTNQIAALAHISPGYRSTPTSTRASRLFQKHSVMAGLVLAIHVLERGKKFLDRRSITEQIKPRRAASL
jgi:cytochrome c553